MKWYEAVVYKRVETGKDATRNPVYELVKSDVVILVRTAPMAARHDSTEGNQFDIIERTFLTKAKPELLDGAAALEVRGELYELEGVAAHVHPIALKVKRFKP